MSVKDDVLLELEERYRVYLGIPRQMIPWFPTVDAENCVGCRECIKFCHDTVYAFDERSKKVYVENPWHCQVYCRAVQF